MKIAITGTLQGLARKEAIALLESMGATFTDNVTYDTNYLVAARLDSNKAKKAAAIGVTVISQSEFEDYLDQGGFPDNKTPTKPIPQFPSIPWKKLAEGERYVAQATYHDQDGVVTQRNITVIAEGELDGRGGHKRRYLQAMDRDLNGQIKTFRCDRILAIARV